MPKEWPIARKGTKFIANASHSKNSSIPLVFILRDILSIAKTVKEAKYFVLRGNVKINNKIRRDVKFPVQVFDVVSLEKINKNYRLEIVNKKFVLKEISGKDVEKKIVKISGKVLLSGNKVQLNLEDGQNFLYKSKFSVGDSVVLDTKKDTIEKILPLKPGAKVEIIAGKHAGKKGELKEIIVLEKVKQYVVKFEEKEVGLPLKTILVIG